jgi:hypothetical protein
VVVEAVVLGLKEAALRFQPSLQQGVGLALIMFQLDLKLEETVALVAEQETQLLVLV